MATQQPNQFISPQQLAKAVAVSESTLKRWIDRGLIRAYRTVGGHRRLLVSDVVAFLRKSGTPITDPTVLGLPAEVSQPAGDGDVQQSLEGLMRALQAGDSEFIESLLTRLYVSGHKLNALFDELLAPALHRIGERWESGDMTVHAEHRATQLLHSAVMLLKNLLPRPDGDAPLAIGGAPEGDPYALGSVMCELSLRDIGWRTVNFGPYLPVKSLANAVLEDSPALVWLSITTLPIHASPKDFESLYRATAETGCRIIIGGQSAARAPEGLVRRDVLGRSMADLVKVAADIQLEVSSRYTRSGSQMGSHFGHSADDALGSGDGNAAVG